jgi:hypothetical protein
MQQWLGRELHMELGSFRGFERAGLNLMFGGVF